MVQLADRVKVSTSSTGTGNIVLGSAESSYQTVPSSLDGETIRIVIEEGSAWEISTATYTHSSTTLSNRTLTSSSTGSLLNLSGSAKVFISPIVDDLQLVQVYSSTSDLPSASDNHGRITHVHGDGAMYFAHGGNWVRLANHSDAYTLPTASSSTLGGVKIGTGLSIDGSGVVTASSSGIALTDLSVTQNSASGSGALTYNNSNGVFSYTPPASTSSSGGTLDPIKETETVVSASTQSAFNVTHAVGNIAVYLNGSRLSDADWNSNSGGTTVTLTAPAVQNDIVTVVEYGAPFAAPYSSNIYTANGSSPFNSGNTVLTANYTQGKEAVYVNGVKYLSSTDYTTNTGGTTITFTSALSAGDIVELVEHGALADAASAFTDLTDTPSALGTAGQVVQVNSGGNALEFADASGGIDNQGTLTKTFVQNEEATITLSNAVSPVPMVSVFKEIPQVGVSSKGAWDVNSTASNYDRLDEAPTSYSGIAITPSNASADGTFSLSSGSIASGDVGKTVEGNGGKAVITATNGAYHLVTAFTNTNAIAAGSWGLFGAVANSDGSGLSLSITPASAYPASTYFPSVTGASGQINTTLWTDINSMTADEAAGNGTVNYAVSTDNRTTWSVNKGTDGVRKIAKNNSGTWQYNNDAGSSSPYQLANASYSNKSASVGSEHLQPSGVAFKSDGTKMYVTGNNADDVSQYSLSTAWDVSTASYDNVSFSVSSQQGYPTGITFKPDGTKMYISGNGNDEVNSYTLSTAWDVSTASYTSVYAMWVPTGGTLDNPQDIFFKPDGTKMYVLSKAPASHIKVWEFGLSTAWDITSASITTSTDFLSVGSQETNAEGLVFSSDGTKVYICGWSNNTVYQYNLSTAWDLSSGSYANISFSLASQETFCRGLAVSSDGTKLYAVGYNNDTVYQYSIEGIQYGTSETWVNATTNNELSALQQALGAQSINRMDKAQLDAIPDANHFPLGNTLDLMIAVQMASGTVAPKSDGVSMNYDAAALNRQAVNGTDYEAEFPSSTSVKIKSLAAQNLKVRVI